MKIRSVGRSRTAYGRSFGFVPGQVVRGRVIARLGEGHFRVGAAGQHFDASSDLPLEPGQRLIARVEVGKSQVFLRILDDTYRQASPKGDNESPDEIRRILEGLGQHPDSMDILEFQERLNRYRPHGNLKGAEPSDVWLLALLWSRGIRGGADAFALLSYYLRRAILEPFDASALPPPPAILAFLCLTGRPADGDADKPAQQPSSGPDQFDVQRKREAEELLNRQADSLGAYRHWRPFSSGFCALLLGQGDRTLGRWADNPTLPLLLLEAGCAQGRIRARLNRMKLEPPASTGVLESWIGGWEENLGTSDLELEEFQVIETRDPEKLRFLFWRTWSPDAVQDLMA